MANANDGFIDAHVHVWTPDTDKYPQRGRPHNPLSFTPDELMALARQSGVSRVVLIQAGQYATDNSYMFWAMENYPGTFSGVAVIDASKNARQTMREFYKKGVRGYRIVPRNDPQGWLDKPEMAEMWAEGADTGAAMCPLINPDALPAVGRMCVKYPRTPVVIDHIARIGATGTVNKEDVDALCALAKHANVHVKISAFYALGRKQPPYRDLAPLIRRVVDAYGANRLMWASDCPYQALPPHSYAASIDLIRSGLSFLKDEDRRWILRGTAERVFFS
ncbi:MAG: amidohydrolase [Bryobacterales bacterium]|nr:amidohydrolase [Bryobacterales bacterium]